MTKKTILSLILCLFVAVTVEAAKSAGKIRMVKQPDGTMLSYQVLGDEWLHWAQTTDGVIITWDNNGFCVGKVTGYGTVTNTGIVAHNDGARSAEEVAAIAAQDENRAIFFTATSASSAKSGLSGNIVTYTSKTICPHAGTITVPVALVQYSDSTFKVNATFQGKGVTPTNLPSAETVRTIFNEYFNDRKESFYLGMNSVGKYFQDASDGKMTLEFELHGPFTLPHNHAYYGWRSKTYNNLFRDALTLLKDSINFDDEKYDINNDGNIDMVTVLFAGGGANITSTENASTDPNDFWPCCWPGNSPYSTIEGITKKIPVIGAFSELDVYPTKVGDPYTRSGVGVTCHELSHGMGMPDLYDTVVKDGSRANNNNNGPEFWDLMDGGENIGDGWYPCQYLAWEKDYLDWNKAVELKEATDVTLKPLNEEGTAYKIVNPADETEYYVIEAAQTKDWNSGLFKYFKHYDCDINGGLLIEHVSKTALTSMSPNNTYNNGYQPSLTLIPADGCLHAIYGLTNGKEYFTELAGDPYPGTGNVTSLASYKEYTKGTVDMVDKYPIYNIKKNEDGSVSFRFGFGLSSSSFNSKSGNLDFDKDVEFAETPAAGLTCDVYSLNTETNVKSETAVAQAILTIDDGNVNVVFKNNNEAVELPRGSYTFTIPDAKIQSEQALPLSATDIQFAVTDSISVKADVKAENVEVPSGSEITSEQATTAVKAAINNAAVTQVETGVKEAVKDTKDINFGEGVVVPEGTPISMTVDVTYSSAAVAKDNDKTIVTSMTFDVKPTATVVVDGTTHTATVANDNLEGNVIFRLPVDKNATYQYANVSHNGTYSTQVSVQTAENNDKYIELSVTEFSTYSYELTNTPTAIDAISEQTEQQAVGVQKVIRGGKVIIVKDGKEYNLAGAIIK